MARPFAPRTLTALQQEFNRLGDKSNQLMQAAVGCSCFISAACLILGRTWSFGATRVHMEVVEQARPYMSERDLQVSLANLPVNMMLGEMRGRPGPWEAELEGLPGLRMMVEPLGTIAWHERRHLLFAIWPKVSHGLHQIHFGAPEGIQPTRLRPPRPAGAR